MYKFSIPGQPVAKARPRFTKSGHTYTPKKTAEFEQLVADSVPSIHFEGPLRVEMVFTQSIPKSWSKKKQLDAVLGKIRPTSRPDIDNFAKAVLDGMQNGDFFKDDSQVVELSLSRWYGVNPRTDVKARPLNVSED